MISKFLKYLFTLSLLLASSAQHVNAAISASSYETTESDYREINCSDDFQIEIIKLVPIVERSLFKVGEEQKREHFDITESEDEVESEKLVSVDNSDNEINYFIANFCAPAHESFQSQIEKIGFTYKYRGDSTPERYILFQVFRL